MKDFISVIATAAIFSVSSAATITTTGSKLAVCPGETREDYRCDHDATHRVCAQLLKSDDKTPISWGKGDFWKLTGQEKHGGGPPKSWIKAI